MQQVVVGSPLISSMLASNCHPLLLDASTQIDSSIFVQILMLHDICKLLITVTCSDMQ